MKTVWRFSIALVVTALVVALMVMLSGITRDRRHLVTCNGIDIRILDEEDSIRVEIEDNGKGIAAKDLPSIFDRFYRTDSSRNSAQGGSGIGLSIVRKVIEDHGGYVWATSREGEGTCVHFVIRKYHEASNLDDYVEDI